MLKLPNSIEPAILAENIVHLRDAENLLDGRVSDLESTAQKDYSTMETATGQKWIDGKDIYLRVFTGDIAEQSSSFTLVYFNDLDINPLYTLGYISNSDETLYTFISRLDTAYVRSTGRLYSASIPVTYSQGKYSLIIYYTKPDPVPGRAPEDSDQEPEEVKEPEEKKTTKKKTTK